MTQQEARVLAARLNQEAEVASEPLFDRWTQQYIVSIRFRGHITVGESPDHAQKVLEALRRQYGAQPRRTSRRASRGASR